MKFLVMALLAGIFHSNRASASDVRRREDAGVRPASAVKFEQACNPEQQAFASKIVQATLQGNRKVLSEYTDNVNGYIMFWSSVSGPEDLKFIVYCDGKAMTTFIIADAVVGGMNTCTVTKTNRGTAGWKILDCTFNDGN